MIAAKVAPLFAEDLVHDGGAKFGMRFPFGAVKVDFSEVADVVDEESDPEARVQWWAVEL